MRWALCISGWVVLIGCEGEVDPDRWNERRARVECRYEGRCAGSGAWFDRVGGVDACVERRLVAWEEEIVVRELVFLENNARQCVSLHRRAWSGSCDEPPGESGLNGECELSVWYPSIYLD